MKPGFGQDPIFSQPFATPTYTNPAFTGTGQFDNGGRASLNHRNQWPSLPETFITTAFSYDQHFDKIKGGLGLLVVQDVAGEGVLTTSSASAMYSYQLEITSKFGMRFGFSGGMIQRKLDFSHIWEFGSSATRGFIKSTSEPIAHNEIITPTFGTGMLAYSKIWHVGISIDHLLEPVHTFYDDPDDVLARRITVHAGSEFPFENWKKPNSSISVNALYVTQAKRSQFDIGSYFNYSWLVSGIWYRRVFGERAYNGFEDAHTYMALVGWRKDKIRIGYSFDLIYRAKRGPIGSHELSVVWEWKEKKIKERTDLLRYPVF